MPSRTKTQAAIVEIDQIFRDAAEIFRASALEPSIPQDEYDQLSPGDTVELSWKPGPNEIEKSEALRRRYRDCLAGISKLSFQFLPSVGVALLSLQSEMESYILMNRFASPSKEKLGELRAVQSDGFVGIYLLEWEALRRKHMQELGQLRTIEEVISEQVEERRGIVVKPIFTSRVDEVRENRAFVLMPISQPWSDRIYRKLSLILESNGLLVNRADELTGSQIMEDVWRGILSAQVVIADLTSRNPNVFYELGLAHVVGKRVILLTQSLDDLPIDFVRFRLIEYEDNLDGYEKLETELKRHIRQFEEESR